MKTWWKSLKKPSWFDCLVAAGYGGMGGAGALSLLMFFL